MKRLLCWLGIHRWIGAYAGGRPGGVGSGKYLWVETCIRCWKEK